MNYLLILVLVIAMSIVWVQSEAVCNSCENCVDCCDNGNVDCCDFMGQLCGKDNYGIQEPMLSESDTPNQLFRHNCPESEWQAWSPCTRSCGGGLKSRKRIADCRTYWQHGKCNENSCQSKCEVTNWCPWSECSVSCGKGTKRRSKTNVDCTMAVQNRTCNRSDCPNCQRGSWSSWGACSVTCGAGFHKRCRDLVDCGEKKRTCTHEICTPNPGLLCDCKIGEWSPWSACDKTCGKNVQKQSTQVTWCPDGRPNNTITNAILCGVPECPNLCETPWSPWSSCSATCGQGEKWRYRNEKCMERIYVVDCELMKCPGPNPGPPCNCLHLYNTDIIGQGMGSLACSSMNRCCKVCRYKPGCKAFAWVDRNGGICYLKNATEPKIYKAGVHTAEVIDIF